MKCIVRNYGVRMDNWQRQEARSRAADLVRARGTGKTPAAPRDLVLQSAPRGILVNWRPGEGLISDISGWRIYRGDELTLYQEIRDPNTMQAFVQTTAGATPPVTNIFVSAISALGQESPLVGGQSSALAEAGAPPMPTPPTTFQQSFSTSSSQTENTGTRFSTRRGGFGELLA